MCILRKTLSIIMGRQCLGGEVAVYEIQDQWFNFWFLLATCHRVHVKTLKPYSSAVIYVRMSNDNVPKQTCKVCHYYYHMLYSK